MEALGVTEQILTIGPSPLDLAIEKPDRRFGAKPCCEPGRNPGDTGDLGLPLPA